MQIITRMGHDLRASVPPNPSPVASLRLTAAKGSKSNLYPLLGADTFNRKHSGSGDRKLIHKQKIAEAIAQSKLLTREELGFLMAIKDYAEIQIEFA